MTDKMTPEQYRAYYGAQKSAKETANRLKFGNIRQEVDGIRFDSKKEAEQYGKLKMLLKAGKIKAFQMQKTFKLYVNDHHICDYRCDFVVLNLDDSEVVQDVKSSATANVRAFQIKKKLMKAVFNIDVQIV